MTFSCPDGPMPRHNTSTPWSRKEAARRPAGLPWDDYAWVVERMRAASQWLRFLAGEMRLPVRLSWGRLLKGWAKGFGRLANLVYGLDRHDPSLYVSSYQQRVASLKINGTMDHVINNKLLLPVLMRSVGLPAVEIWAFRRRGNWMDGSGAAIGNFSAWLAASLSVGKKAVLKPVKGHKGLGIAFIEHSTAGLMVNGRAIGDIAIERFFSPKRDVLLAGFVEQADYARALYPNTSNSIRVLTAWDIDLGQPFIAAAAQRIGNCRSFPVDNWLEGLGGLCAEIDLETGKLGAAATVSDRERITWHARHPETGSQIQGLVIPGWSAMQSALCKGAKGLPFAPLLGWDILVTRDGFRVLELNGPPGLHVHQVHRPLLKDPRLRRFYSTYGIGREAKFPGTENERTE